MPLRAHLPHDTIWAWARVSHARIAIILSAIEEKRTWAGLQHCYTLPSPNRTSISMGAAVSFIVPIATAVAGLLLNLRSKPAGDNPTHNDIEAANRLQREQQERDEQHDSEPLGRRQTGLRGRPR
ncbi:hypothetical protein B0H13DRAFT_2327058 [Mycena leptocephala]|nr:hypothetical protein B0H13DRAFT_2327058 [Mycena leptocephala]